MLYTTEDLEGLSSLLTHLVLTPVHEYLLIWIQISTLFANSIDKQDTVENSTSSDSNEVVNVVEIRMA